MRIYIPTEQELRGYGWDVEVGNQVNAMSRIDSGGRASWVAGSASVFGQMVDAILFNGRYIERGPGTKVNFSILPEHFSIFNKEATIVAAVCTCDIHLLMREGCRCGALAKERSQA